MNDFKLWLVEKKLDLQERYISLIEHESYNQASLLRAKLALLDEIIVKMGEEEVKNDG